MSSPLILMACYSNDRAFASFSCLLRLHFEACLDFSDSLLNAILGNSLGQSQCYAHLEGTDVCFELGYFTFSDRPHVHRRYFKLPSGSTDMA